MKNICSVLSVILPKNCQNIVSLTELININQIIPKQNLIQDELKEIVMSSTRKCGKTCRGKHKVISRTNSQMPLGIETKREAKKICCSTKYSKVSSQPIYSQQGSTKKLFLTSFYLFNCW